MGILRRKTRSTIKEDKKKKLWNFFFLKCIILFKVNFFSTNFQPNFIIL